MSLMELLAGAAQAEPVRFPPFHMCHLSLREQDCWVGREAASVRSSTAEIQIFASLAPSIAPKDPGNPIPCTGGNVQDGSPGAGPGGGEERAWLRASQGLA